MFTENISEPCWLIMLKLVTFMHQLLIVKRYKYCDYKDIGISILLYASNIRKTQLVYKVTCTYTTIQTNSKMFELYTL